jgi:carbonic anhydrase
MFVYHFIILVLTVVLYVLLFVLSLFQYEDSWCPLDQLIEADAFTIERHALRISQPITVDEDDNANIDCFVEGKGSRFGRLDYSKGFSQWWFLSHIDIHTPSEHTQEGKRYDAELQLHHFYSVNATAAGVDNELGTVSMFLEAYDDAAPYRYLDKVLCQWRRAEHETRTACGLDPIPGSYPGCFPYQNGRNLRKTAQKEKTAKNSQFQTVQDLILAHDHREKQLNKGMNVSELPKLQMDSENWDPAEKTEEEWAEYIAKESAQFKRDEELWKELHQEFNGDAAKAHDEFHNRGRNLLEGDEIEWFNYWPMLGVRTEYYYRYSGSQTIPPCYGNFDPDSRKGTLHWRVMKDPVRIHPRQLTEMKRLIAERVAPPNDPVMACQPDTAAKVSTDGRAHDVDTARPLQYFHPIHFKVFCECKDWPSKWPEDREWCDIEDINERFYTTPYNFQTNGF